MPLHINNLFQGDIPEEWKVQIESVLPFFFTQEAVPEEAVVGLTFSDDAYIQAINLEYRGMDSATDVLSFPMFEPDEPIKAFPGEDLLLGDILISVPRVYAQSEAYAHSATREALYLFVHGLLHLAGYDHQEEEERNEMRAREEALLAAIGVERDNHV